MGQGLPLSALSIAAAAAFRAFLQRYISRSAWSFTASRSSPEMGADPRDTLGRQCTTSRRSASQRSNSCAHQGLPVCVFQQHTELVAADAVTVAAVGIGFFDAVGDLGQADVSL